MAPVPDLDARLRARWQKHGGGPTLEARLKAAEAELSRRANVTVAERRGVRVPDASRVPVADPTPFGKENDHTKRTGDGKPPNYPSSIDPAAALSAAMKTTRAQTARSAAASNVDPHSIGMRGQKPGGGGGDDSSDDEEVLALEAGCVVVGESAADCQKKTNTNPSLGLNPNDPLVKLKNEANQSLLRGDFAIAGALYDEAVAAAVARLKQESDAPNASELSQTTHTSILLAVLYSNRAHVKMLSDPVDALGASADASCAIKQQNSNSKWHKPYLRKAAAEAYLGNWRLAMRCAREAESIASCQKNQKALREAVAILDTVAMNAAKEGSMAGFDGRTIYVRSSGEDAWLCREAPTNPAFDDDDDNAIVDEHGVYSDAHATGDSLRTSAQCQEKPIHARSLKEAVEKARDGDVVILLRGIHNGCGDSVTITKRIAISGEGHLREASIDARNNSPVFRIKRACWIRNVEFDFTGFSEAIRVESSEQNDGASSPLIERCAVKCTGADAVVVAGNSSPTFRDVSFEAKKCGMRVCDTSKCRLVDCKLSGCQTQGLRVTDSGTCVGVSCVFSENGHEGIVATANAKINLTSCVVHKNCGPGVDVTNNAFVSMKNTQITNNVGGVWSWDQSSFELENCVVDGGKSHAILADENCTNCFCTSGTTIKGVCHASENVRQQIAPGLDNTCVVEHPAQPTDLPHENGCFKFEHDMYTRRQ